MIKQLICALCCWLVTMAIAGAAEGTAELHAAFRKQLDQAAADEQLETNTRERLRAVADRFLHEREQRTLSPEIMRHLAAGRDVELPATLRAAALALAEALEREQEVHVREWETLAGEVSQRIAEAADAKALEAPAEKLAAAMLQARGTVARTERGQAVLQQLSQLQRTLQRWQEVFNKRDAGNALGAMQQLASLAQELQSTSAPAPAPFREKMETLARALGGVTAAEAEAEMRETIAKTLAATSAKELDSLLKALRSRRELWSAAQPLIGNESAALAERVSRFAASWQEYLAAKSAGASDRVRSILAELARADTDVPGLRRSELLERSLAEPTKPPASPMTPMAPGSRRLETLISECKTLADLEKKMPEMEAAAGVLGVHLGSAGQDLLSGLRAIHRDYQDAKVASPPQLTATRETSASALLTGLRNQLALFVFSRQFGEPAQDGDTPSTYLRRRLLGTRDAKDWRGMQRVLEAAITAGVRQQLCPPSDGAALTHYLGGVNFEESGVTRFAVAAYLATLQTGSDLIPIEELRSRLARLRSEQPAEYEEGLKTAASGGLPISAVEKELREAPETRSRPRALR